MSKLKFYFSPIWKTVYWPLGNGDYQFNFSIFSIQLNSSIVGAMKETTIRLTILGFYFTWIYTRI